MSQLLPRLKVESWPVGRLVPYERNARTHSAEQIAQIAASISEFGFVNPVLVASDDGIIAGHGRLAAAKDLGMVEVPVIVLDHLDAEQRRAYVIADNQLALNAGWDADVLQQEVVSLSLSDFDLSLLGFGDDELAGMLDPDGLDDEGSDQGRNGDGDGYDPDDPTRPPGQDGGPSGAGSLAARFGVPPFTVLNAREGWWQDRKRSWLALGIRSEEGRGDNGAGAPGGSAMPACDYSDKQRGDGAGRSAQPEPEKSKFGKCLETGIGEACGREPMNATSIFDPVVCELAYSWFSPPGGTVLDPFAGGSVRGVVASRLGRPYVGIELRAEQVDANREQGAELCQSAVPVWHCGDSRDMAELCPGVEADFVFSCPPYADLEVYSDDPKDLSTLDYADFRAAYFEIIAKACSKLKEDRFACFVVGDVRDRKGAYYNFVGDTVEAFRSAGLNYYNEAILVTCVGSLPVRAGKAFTTSRKLGKTHQNILVFVKGDAKRATLACGECQFGGTDPAAELGEVLE